MRLENIIKNLFSRSEITISDSVDDGIMAKALKAFDLAAKKDRQLQTHKRMNFIKRFSVAAIIIGILVAGYFSFARFEMRPPQKHDQVAICEKNVQQCEVSQQVQLAAKMAEELKKIEAMFNCGDVQGLIGALDSDLMEIKAACANYLAELGSEQAIEKLQLMSNEFMGDDTDNVFAAAVRKIRKLNDQKDLKVDDSNLVGINNDKSDVAALRLFITAEEDGSGIGQAIVKVRMREAKSKERIKKEYITDANGLCLIELCEGDIEDFDIKVEADKRVWMRMRWGKYSKVRNIPKEYTISMTKGTTIGATVVNEQNEPVADAKVQLVVPSLLDKEPVVNVIKKEAITDEQGKWEIDIMPNDDMISKTGYNGFAIDVIHKDYADAGYGYGLADREIGPLRDKSEVMVLKKGFKIFGFAVDQNGNPISNAAIQQTIHGVNEDRTRTDINGRFEFDKVDMGNVILTAIAGGFGPVSYKAVITEDNQEFNFVLGPGGELLGIVVDENGNAIDDATVHLSNWRGNSSINQGVKTDADGSFLFPNLPINEQVTISAYRDGYQSIKREVMVGQEEYRFEMHPEIKVFGKVQNAETKEPVKKFTIIHGTRSREDERIIWQTTNQREEESADGRFKDDSFWAGYSFIVKVQSQGYRPEVSREILTTEGNVELEFLMEKGEDISGVVYLPDGSVAKATEVYLISKGEYLHFFNGENSDKVWNSGCLSDDEGKFRFGAEPDRYLIIAVHEKGFGEIESEDLVKTGRVDLRKWGRIEGVVYDGLAAAVGCEVSISTKKGIDGAFKSYYRIKTDAKGRFVVDKAIAAKTVIPKLLSSEKDQWTPTGGQELEREVYPGETLVVEIGGTGRTVVGTIVVPGWLGLNDFDAFSCWIVSKITDDKLAEISEGLDFPEPNDLEQISSEELLQWYRYSKATNEFGRQLLAKKKIICGNDYVNRFALREADGQFKIEDVPAGDYKLLMKFYARGNNNHADWNKLLFESKYEFTMPEVHSNNIGETFDLGEVSFVPTMNLKAELAAPDFEITDSGGGKISLDSLKDKTILIYYWDPLIDITTDCKNRIDGFKSTYKKFADSDRFEILCVYYNRGRNIVDEMIKKYHSENHIQWMIGIGNSQFYNDYGINDVLIGLDGKVIAINPDNAELETIIAELISQ